MLDKFTIKITLQCSTIRKFSFDWPVRTQCQRTSRSVVFVVLIIKIKRKLYVRTVSTVV